MRALFCLLTVAALLVGCSRDAATSPSPSAEGTVTFDSANGTTLAGTFAPAGGGTAVRFTVTSDPVAGTAEAKYTAGSTTVGSRLLGDGSATLTWSGLELNGIGPRTDAEKSALTQLSTSTLAGALARVPLEIGCVANSDAPQLAALLFPWQMLLKYVDANRATSVKTFAKAVSCAYFHELTLDGGAYPPATSRLRLENDTLVPNVFGIFPFDKNGATELTGVAQSLVGDAIGPCGALCRGACGPDCTPNNCQVGSVDRQCSRNSDGTNNGMATSNVKLSCGVHQGCIDHDQCYDDCHKDNGCGTWAAASCRRGCDTAAAGTWGVENATSWMNGGGPFARQQEFLFTDVHTVYDPTHCPPGTTCTVTLSAYAAGDGGTSDGGANDVACELGAGRYVLDPGSFAGCFVTNSCKNYCRSWGADEASFFMDYALYNKDGGVVAQNFCGRPRGGNDTCDQLRAVVYGDCINCARDQNCAVCNCPGGSYPWHGPGRVVFKAPPSRDCAPGSDSLVCDQSNHWSGSITFKVVSCTGSDGGLPGCQ